MPTVRFTFRLAAAALAALAMTGAQSAHASTAKAQRLINAAQIAAYERDGAYLNTLAELRASSRKLRRELSRRDLRVVVKGSDQHVGVLLYERGRVGIHMVFTNTRL